MKHLAALFLTACALAGPAAAEAATPHVTFIGDSVPAAIAHVADARRELERGLDVTLELRICRNLAQRSCTYEGETPPSALDVIETTGRGLGDTGINRAIRRARSQWPELAVLDWAYLSRDKPWFWHDRLHLNYGGAIALARLVRATVLSIDR